MSAHKSDEELEQRNGGHDHPDLVNNVNARCAVPA
jgi:hypothetical protein